jgi:hypothetical protein
MQRRLLSISSVLCAFVLVIGLCGCKSQADSVREALTPTLDSYLTQADSDKKNETPDPDYGDSATISVLEAYGIDVSKLHELCFARFSYEIGDVKVADDGNSATANVKITNVSLAAAATNAAADYSVYADSEEAQTAYAQNGHKALLQHLFDLLFAHLQSDDLVTTEVTLTLNKNDDGSWISDASGNTAFYNALYGGSNVLEGLATALK